MYKTVLAAVDGSEYAEAALDRAIEIAKANKSKLVIATVYKIPEVPAGKLSIANLPRAIPDSDKVKLESMLKKYAERAKDKDLIHVETDVIPTLDSVGAALVKEAESLGCALTVIASRGMTGIKRTLLGSTAGYVTEYTACDVLIVRR